MEIAGSIRRDAERAIVSDTAAAPRRDAFVHAINHMRGIAVLPIVATHCYSAFDWRPGSLGAHMSAVWGELNILFIFISGYLFQHLSARFVYPRYLRAKLRNVILPYLIVSTPAVVIYALDLKQHPYFASTLAAMSVPVQLLYLFATGIGLGPLWFIPMMAIFYLLAPLLLAIDRRPLLYCSIPVLLLLSMTVVPRPVHDGDPPLAAAHFLPIYLLGMAISHNARIALPVLRAWWRPLVMLALLGVGAEMWGAYAHVRTPALLVALSECLAAFACMLALPAARVGWLDLFARYSFGVFFVHGYVVGAIRVLGAQHPSLTRGSLPAFIVAMAFVLAVSLATVALCRRLLGLRSRMVVGS